MALALLTGVHQAAAQGTAFTYQGQLNNDGQPANGFYDFEFSLSNAPSGGSHVGSTITQEAVGVTNGSFMTTLDFGAVFTGNDTWLAMSVRSNGVGSYTPLTPLQELTPTPYSIFSTTAGAVSGDIGLAQLPSAVLTNNESNVTFSNLTVRAGGGLAITFPFSWTADFSFLGSPAINHILQADENLNFTAGLFAGNLTMTGSYNSGFGTFVLANNTTGNENAALGFDALQQNTTGGTNTAVGDGALQANQTGFNNAAVGGGALQANQGGFWNVAVGDASLGADANGFANTAVGYNALSALTAGFSDIALGENAGDTLTSGYNDIYIGNGGNASEDDVIRIGFAQNQTYIAGNVCLGGAAPQQTLNIDGGMTLDQSGQNIGTVANALTFGSGSGEGIGSIRTSGYTDSYGLNFYTDYGDRMTILQHGNVGINTTNPTTQLEVNGEYLQVDGLGGVKCYLGDDGSGNDVQLGSQKSGITEIGFYNTADAAYMHINCSSITIRGGADLAEPFPMSHSPETITAGDVVVIDENNPGQLKLSRQAYDSRVAGVVSGANGIHPGIQMLQQGVLDGGKNVALSGRVYVQADASNGPIAPGDLLTTSDTPGYAMKVTDHARAQGAILGKAMTGLASGKGQVLTLVTLQ